MFKDTFLLDMSQMYMYMSCLLVSNEDCIQLQVHVKFHLFSSYTFWEMR